jgi:hypothetical protein
MVTFMFAALMPRTAAHELFPHVLPLKPRSYAADVSMNVSIRAADGLNLSRSIGVGCDFTQHMKHSR